MGTNFLGSPNSTDFTAISQAMGNWWGNPCISHIIEYTIECESNGKKALILWEKYEYQFPRFSTYNGFCGIFLGTNFRDFPIWLVWLSFPMLWEINEKTNAFPMWWSIPLNGNLLEKKRPYYGKSMSTNIPGSPYYNDFSCIFLYYGKLMGKPMHFPYDEVCHRMGI